MSVHSLHIYTKLTKRENLPIKNRTDLENLTRPAFIHIYHCKQERDKIRTKRILVKLSLPRFDSTDNHFPRAIKDKIDTTHPVGLR